MSIGVVSTAVSNNGWMVFWIQLPVLVLALSVIIVAITALRRARPQDVPRVFEAFASAFGRRSEPPARARLRRARGTVEDTK